MAQLLRALASRGHEFKSQQLHGDSQHSVTPVPGELIPSSGLGMRGTWGGGARMRAHMRVIFLRNDYIHVYIIC